MTEGVIWKQILAFALPILLSNVIQRLYNAVDSIVVGRFVGHEALAAVGSNNSIINVFVSLFWEYPWARALSSRNTTAQRTMKNSKIRADLCVSGDCFGHSADNRRILPCGAHIKARSHPRKRNGAESRIFADLFLGRSRHARIQYGVGRDTRGRRQQAAVFVFAVRVLLEYRAGRSVRKDARHGRCGRGVGDSYFAIRIGDFGHIKASSDKTEL